MRKLGEVLYDQDGLTIKVGTEVGLALYDYNYYGIVVDATATNLVVEGPVKSYGRDVYLSGCAYPHTSYSNFWTISFGNIHYFKLGIIPSSERRKYFPPGWGAKEIDYGSGIINSGIPGFGLPTSVKNEHKMGIDREEVDWDAWKAFKAGL